MHAIEVTHITHKLIYGAWLPKVYLYRLIDAFWIIPRSALKMNHPDNEVNILLLGTSGAGKYTIAKHIADDDNFPDKRVHKGVYHITSRGYKFVLIDTAGAQLDPLQSDKRIIGKLIRKEVQDTFSNIVHLIVIVVRKDCYIMEEVDSLAYIVETLFTKESRQNIALIHSGCEDLQNVQREAYINKFSTNDGPAGKLSSLCEKKTLAVGFPNIEETAENYIYLHRQSIRRGNDDLKSMCVSLEDPPQYSNLFQPKAQTVTCFLCIVM